MVIIKGMVNIILEIVKIKNSAIEFDLTLSILFVSRWRCLVIVVGVFTSILKCDACLWYLLCKYLWMAFVRLTGYIGWLMLVIFVHIYDKRIRNYSVPCCSVYCDTCRFIINIVEINFVNLQKINTDIIVLYP